MTNATTFLKDYHPPAFRPSLVSLEFDLHDEYVLVSNTMQLQREHPGPLYLDGDDLELCSIHLNGELLAADAYERQTKGLTILNCPDALTLIIVTRIYPQNNTALSGLYRSQDLFCTQCEAEGFRCITYFFDRPDVLAIYHTRITANKTSYPVLLSNGNLIDSGDTDDGRHWVLWHDPFKKPCYLFALVAGNLVSVSDIFETSSGRNVDLFIYTEHGFEDQCEHAMQSLKKAMRWDEVEYGREYDLARFMIVAVREFNMGAMENKGLNIFNSKYILAHPTSATDKDYAGIESVVAHEYFHNWTGNRVTCRDWFQLSLKEGLTVFRDQEFSRDMNSRDVNRISDVSLLQQIQFPEDAGSMAHPVRPESYEEIDNFYTATIYNKGAEVIRMQQTLLGKEGFRKGMDLYFERHDGHAVTIDDFVAAMEDANGVDFTQFKRWYSQAGTPLVTVESEYKQGTLTLNFTQVCRKTPDNHDKEPFHIPIRIALFTEAGCSMPLEKDILELREATQTFRVEGVAEKPLVSLLGDFSAPIVLHHTTQNEDTLLALLRFETNGFAKWNAQLELTLSCLTTCYHAPNNAWKISTTLIEAYRYVLNDTTLDFALRAELLTLPSVEDVMAKLTDIDVSRVVSVLDFFRVTIGRALSVDLKATYQTLWKEEDHTMQGKAYGRRQLRNLCLWLLLKSDEASHLQLCLQQWTNAHLMTDQIASCALLMSVSSPNLRHKATHDFYQQWQHNPLVVDKWLAMQATCELPETLLHVYALLEHPVFDMKDPNKVRAVVGAFCQGNARYFHAADGSGYQFLTKVLIKLDKINPQIAARLATPFTRGARLDSPRQALIKQELLALKALDLSSNLQELVTKSLASYA